MRLFLALGLLAATAFVSTAQAQSTGRLAPYAEPDFSELGDEARRLMTPGLEHKRLEFMIGRFEVTGDMSADPDSPYQVLTGTVESGWILGGRFVESRGVYDWEGQPIHTYRITGFDSFSGEYFDLDIDNWRTFPIIKRGRADEVGRNIALSYAWGPPGGPPRLITQVLTRTDDDTYTIVSWEILPDGSKDRRSTTVFRRVIPSPTSRVSEQP